MMDMTSKNVKLHEDVDAIPQCNDLVLRVEAYFVDSLSTPRFSALMAWHSLVAHLKNGEICVLHRKDKLR